MPPIKTGPTTAVGRIEPGSVNLQALRNAAGLSETGTEKKPTASATAEVVRGDALDPGQPPIDTDRVAMIRKAVETGTYPILPATVADAIIAAGLLLRVGK